jgi:non-heme chloroperoxidase
MGGGETVRYIARHGESRVAKAALVGAVTPFLLKTTTNPNRAPIEVFDGMRAAVQAKADRSQWNKDVTMPYYSFNRSGAVVSEACARSAGVRAWRPGSCLDGGSLGARVDEDGQYSFAVAL